MNYNIYGMHSQHCDGLSFLSFNTFYAHSLQLLHAPATSDHTWHTKLMVCLRWSLKEKLFNIWIDGYSNMSVMLVTPQSNDMLVYTGFWLWLWTPLHQLYQLLARSKIMPYIFWCLLQYILLNLVIFCSRAKCLNVHAVGMNAAKSLYFVIEDWRP